MKPNPRDIFKDTAWYYARYRREYQPQIFDDVVSCFDLDRKGTLLDLGCGTGEIAIPLSSHFEKVIGIDASPNMLAEAKIKSDKASVSNIEWIEKNVDEIDLSIDPIRLTSSGVSFHWMNQPVLLERIYNSTEKNGGMVIIGDSSPVRGKEKTEDWKMKRKGLIIEYLGEDRRAGDHLHKDIITEKRPYEDIINESPFKITDFREYSYTTVRSIDEIVGFLYSTSYASRHLFGDKLDEFEKELREELLKLVPSGEFVEEGKSYVFFLKK